MDDVSSVDFSRSRSILTEDGCTELYMTNVRVLGRENVSLRDVSDVPGRLLKYNDDLRRNVTLGRQTGMCAERDVITWCNWRSRGIVLEWWDIPSDAPCDKLAKLDFGGTSFSSSTSAREENSKTKGGVNRKKAR